MWKMAILGTILGASGWAVMQGLQNDKRERVAPSAGSEGTEKPENVLSIEEYRKKHYRQQGRPVDALRVVRAAVDLRMRDVIERDAA